MHHGVYKGELAAQSRVLILGESHHDDEENASKESPIGRPASYSTEWVVKNYLKHPTRKQYTFFDKIVQTFGCDPEQDRASFWEKVHFGNYIYVLCGVKSRFAADFLKKDGERQECNDRLFRYVNEHGISRIYCFSILAYNHLPSLAKHPEEYDLCEVIGNRGKKNVYLRQCFYKANVEHAHTTVTLKQDLEVWGITHPSAPGGYPLELYANVLAHRMK